MKTILTGLLLLLYSFAIGQGSVTEAEYFIDHDPGYGNGNIFASSGNPVIIAGTYNQDLSPGLHTFYLRVKNDKGIWGMAESFNFLVQEDYTSIPVVPDPIVGMEYFVDVDPGVGLGTYVALEEKDTLILDELLELELLEVGMHKIGIRIQSKSGSWGLWEWREFEVEKGPCDDFAVTLIGSENNLCHGKSLGSIDILVSGGSDNYAYTWSNSATSEDLSELAIGLYSVTVTDNDLNCIGTLEETITEPPEIIITSTTKEVVAGNDGSADVSVVGGAGGYTYSWSNGADTEDLDGVTAGEYTVTVTDANGCSASGTMTIGDIITGIGDEAENEELSLYPNPAEKYLIVQMDLKEKEDCTVRMLNLDGKIVLEKRFEKRSTLKEQINLSQIRAGVYAIVVSTKKSNSIRKVSITK